MLLFQENEVYRTALELIGLIADLDYEGMPIELQIVVDKLQERSLEMLIDLAHAANGDEAARRDRLSSVRGAAFACAAMLDICHQRSTFDETRHQQANALLERIVELIEK